VSTSFDRSPRQSRRNQEIADDPRQTRARATAPEAITEIASRRSAGEKAAAVAPAWRRPIITYIIAWRQWKGIGGDRAAQQLDQRSPVVIGEVVRSSGIYSPARARWRRRFLLCVDAG
jgi:hypothetical protein